VQNSCAARGEPDDASLGQPISAALVSQCGVPVAIRVSAGLLLARTRLRRWSRRAAVAVTATFTVALLAAPAVVVVALVIRQP